MLFRWLTDIVITIIRLIDCSCRRCRRVIVTTIGPILRRRWLAPIHNGLDLHLINRCVQSDHVIAVPLTTEEEGIALLAGAWLGGERGALLMQSSGVGNCLNMLSLTRVCQMPLLMLVTMRGEPGEFNPWQVPMGENTEALLTTGGVKVFPVSRSDQLEQAVATAAAMVFDGPAAAAVLMSQRILGVKSFEQ